MPKPTKQPSSHLARGAHSCRIKIPFQASETDRPTESQKGKGSFFYFVSFAQTCKNTGCPCSSRRLELKRKPPKRVPFLSFRHPHYTPAPSQADCSFSRGLPTPFRAGEGFLLSLPLPSVGEGYCRGRRKAGIKMSCGVGHSKTPCWQDRA